MKVEICLLFLALILFSLAIFLEFRNLEKSIKKLSRKIDGINNTVKEIKKGDR